MPSLPNAAAIQVGKGNKQRIAYLNTEPLRIVKRWFNVRNPHLDAKGFLFNPISKVGTIQTRKLSTQAVYAIIQQRADQAQIEPIRPHNLIKTFVTQLLEASIDINIARQLVGHTDIQTTARYDLRDDKLQKSVIKLLVY
ncbi:tyrosine-type recombinase/integrase [Methylotuvimicrobium sp. KM1]|uniref:tyrosine-type recombinase/integrase n=1 Tax=Methylotuvimicrobium sp. KM1 TaxID=3377707 RepID=UPI00384C7F49